MKRLVLLIAAVAAIAIFAVAAPASAQALSRGCTFVNTFVDNNNAATISFSEFTFNAGERITVQVQEPGVAFEIVVNGQSFSAVSPAVIYYTVPQTGIIETLTFRTTNASLATFTASCVAPAFTATANARFGHGDAISISRFEQPNVVFQFGQASGEALANPRLVCAISGPATFNGQIFTHGAFANAARSDNNRLLTFTGRSSVARGQNYNVQFGINPNGMPGQNSVITCTLSGDNFASVVDMLTVVVR